MPQPNPPPAAGSATPAALEVECRAKRGADEIELNVDWGAGGGVGKGTLKTTTAGKVDARAVRVELYKGVLLVDAPEEKNPANHLARVDEIDGKKSIQIGDDKAPRLPCE